MKIALKLWSRPLALLTLIALPCVSQAQNSPSDETSLFYLDVMDGYFYKAKLNWLANEDKYAAIEVERAAELLPRMANFKTDHGKFAELASQTLLRVASKLKAGEKVTLREMHITFAQAQVKLARFNYARAKIFLDQGNLKNAGYSMRLMMHHFAHALTWSGHYVGISSKPFPQDQMGWHDFRKAVGDILRTLETGGTVGKEKITQLIDLIRKETIKLDTLIEQSGEVPRI